MTTPVSASFSTGNSTGGSIAVTMPAGISAGDLLLVAVVAHNDSSNVAVDRAVSGNAWWQAGAFTNSFLNTPGLKLFAKIATGSDALTLLDINNSIPQLAYIAIRITGHGSAITVSAKVQSNNSNADPPSLTQSGAAQDTLWIALLANASVASTAAPTGYSNYTTSRVAGGVTLAYADNGIASSSTQDPGTFTCGNDFGIALTLAIASTAIATKARATQVSAEVLSQVDPKARVTQVSVETLTQVDSKARITQVAVEVLSSVATSSTARPYVAMIG